MSVLSSFLSFLSERLLTVRILRWLGTPLSGRAGLCLVPLHFLFANIQDHNLIGHRLPSDVDSYPGRHSLSPYPLHMICYSSPVRCVEASFPHLNHSFSNRRLLFSAWLPISARAVSYISCHEFLLLTQAISSKFLSSPAGGLLHPGLPRVRSISPSYEHPRCLLMSYLRLRFCCYDLLLCAQPIRPSPQIRLLSPAISRHSPYSLSSAFRRPLMDDPPFFLF